MLHLVRLLERRFGAQRASHLVARLLLASVLLLSLGLGLLLSGRVAAQDAADVDGAGIATRESNSEGHPRTGTLSMPRLWRYFCVATSRATESAACSLSATTLSVGIESVRGISSCR